MSLVGPLRPGTYLRRRPARALPTAFVIAAVTFLLVVVMTPGNTFRSTLDANLGALGTFTVVSPASRPAIDSGMRGLLDKNPFAERWALVKAIWFRYPMMIGEGSCPFILARPEEARALLDRMGLQLVAGRYPSGPEPVLALQEDVALARGLRVGDRMGTLVDPDDIVPGSFEVVGLVRGSSRVAVGVVGSGTLASMLHARLPTFALVYPRPGQKLASDRYLHAARDGDGAAFQVIDAPYARKRAERALRNLPLLLRFISLASGTIVAIVAMLLSLLTFQSRLSEFAVLLAIGQSHGRLIRSLVAELSLLAAGSWLVGVALGLLALQSYDMAALRPRGILMQVWDPGVLLASTAIPFLVVLAGAAALSRSLRRIDPVAAIQRREA